MELPHATVKQLRSTILLDSGKAVSFVPERTRRTDEDTETEGNLETTPETSLQLTGEEASEFYEEVLSLPQQGMGVLGTKRRIPRRQKGGNKVMELGVGSLARKKSNADCAFQLFQYAQDNEIELLQSALSSEHFDVNMQDNFHWTLLMVAAHAGHGLIVESLLERGAKWREYTDRGMNAADLARSRGHAHVADLIEGFKGIGGKEGEEGVKEKIPEISKQQHRSGGGKRRNRKFYCKLCQAVVTQSPRVSHDTSIVHLYSCQHHGSNVVPYGIPESNRGFQMLLRSGWNPEKGLGSHKQGHRFPVKTVLKQDRLGLGVPGGSGKAKVTHFSAHDQEAVRTHRDRHKKGQQPPKKKKDILQEQHRERQWERRVRTLMNHEDSHLFT